MGKLKNKSIGSKDENKQVIAFAKNKGPINFFDDLNKIKIFIIKQTIFKNKKLNIIFLIISLLEIESDQE